MDIVVKLFLQLLKYLPPAWQTDLMSWIGDLYYSVHWQEEVGWHWSEEKKNTSGNKQCEKKPQYVLLYAHGVECIQHWSNTADCQQNVQHEHST